VTNRARPADRPGSFPAPSSRKRENSARNLWKPGRST
jgi:hypothetical protein